MKLSEAQFRSNEVLYLKQLAEAQGKKPDIVDGFKYPLLPDIERNDYNPEHNVEQRWELLSWYVLQTAKDEETAKELQLILLEMDRPIVLILASLSYC